MAVAYGNRNDATGPAATNRVANTQSLNVRQFAVTGQRLSLHRGRTAETNNPDKIRAQTIDPVRLLDGQRLGKGYALESRATSDLDTLIGTLDDKAAQTACIEELDEGADPRDGRTEVNQRFGHSHIFAPPMRGYSPAAANHGKVVALFLYPRGIDLGEIPEMVGKAGLDAFEVDFARLRERGGISSLRHTASPAIVVLPLHDPNEAWISSDPNVVSILRPPVNRAEISAAIRGAVAAATNRALERASHEGTELLGIAQALSSERDITRLEQLIVRKARELTDADAGSLYVLEESDGTKMLRFTVTQTGPTDEGVFLGSLLPLTGQSIAGYVASTGETLRIDDVYSISEASPYSFNRSYDNATGYRTKSMLCVPMRSVDGRIVGAIQLINRKRSFHIVLGDATMVEANVQNFDDHDEGVLAALAAQAAVSIVNAQLVESIQELFENFVHASVKAIEGRDRATQGHSERVAALTVAQAKAISEIGVGPLANLHFSDDELRELRYASLLHDFGKVAVPEYIFAKAKKLPDGRLDTIRLRFLLAIEQAPDARTRAELQALLAKIVAANEPVIVDAAADSAMHDAMQRMYLGDDGEQPLITPRELDFLSIPRGSLSDDERERMQEHVTQSFYFLREIPWGRTPWKNVAELAYGHHEHLDGTGYPRKLAGDQIAPQVRMMTIADVFDALTAGDRPYKKGLSVERALDILEKEFSQRGKIDPLLLDVFITQRVYDSIKPQV